MMRDKVNLDYLKYSLEDVKEKIHSILREERIQAVLALNYNNYGDDSIDYLRELIVKDPDPTIREIAIIAYSNIAKEDDKTFLENIFKTYKERNNFVKARAVWALSELSSASNFNVFLEALQNENWEICYWAINGLANIFEKELPIKELTILCKTTNEVLRQTIAWVFAIAKCQEALKLLSNLLLEDKSANVRLNAAWALERINQFESLPVLNLALKNEMNSLVKREVIIGLGKILDHNNLTNQESSPSFQMEAAINEAIRTLSMILQRDSNYYIRRVCAEVLGKIRKKQASEVLLNVFTSEVNQFVRKAIAEALGEIKEEEALPLLQKAMKSQYKIVAEASAKAILKIKSKG